MSSHRSHIFSTTWGCRLSLSTVGGVRRRHRQIAVLLGGKWAEKNNFSTTPKISETMWQIEFSRIFQFSRHAHSLTTTSSSFSFIQINSKIFLPWRNAAPCSPLDSTCVLRQNTWNIIKISLTSGVWRKRNIIYLLWRILNANGKLITASALSFSSVYCITLSRDFIPHSLTTMWVGYECLLLV